LGGDSEAVRPLKHRRDSKRYFLAKSVEDFNSLHAQREACEAFIASQQGEGQPSGHPSVFGQKDSRSTPALAYKIPRICLVPWTAQTLALAFLCRNDGLCKPSSSSSSDLFRH
jgi:hypothetical protein